MISRIPAVFLVFAAVGSGQLNAQEDSSVRVGDHLFVRMTGERAKEYAKRSGLLQENKAPASLKIEASAMVTQTLDNGRVRVEHWLPIKRKGKQEQLLTLAAIVNRTEITSDVTRKGTPVYASPGAHKNGAKPSLITEDATELRLQLSDLKGLKLRTWTLASEIGE